MVSTFTPNIGLEIPARGDDVGTWDTPVGNDFTLTDLTIGGIATIGLNNANVVLATAQFRAKQITFNSTLTGSVAITFPTSFTKSYEIQHLCTGSSAFTITLQTTVAGGQAIAVPPGTTIDCFNDGTNLKFKNLYGPIGSYIDYGGSSMPNWNAACTVPPLLNCDGSAIPAAYTVLPIILGSSLLPDSRGRFRAAANQTTGRLNSSVSGLNGNTVGSAGGSELLQSHNHNLTLTDPGHTHGILVWNTAGAGNVFGAAAAASQGTATTNNSTTGITVVSSAAGSGAAQNIPPAYIGGLTLIRAA